MSAPLELFSYWRSSAAYRVRIGLHLKALAYLAHPVHLVRDGGEQHAPAYAQLNPQELVPTLRHGAVVIPQSLAIWSIWKTRSRTARGCCPQRRPRAPACAPWRR